MTGAGPGAGPGAGLAAAVVRAVRRTRRQAAVAVALGVAGVVPGVLVVAWLIGDWPLGAGPLTLLLAGVVSALALALRLTRRWVLAVDETALAAAAEREHGLADGALRGVLELGRELPDGVSRGLLERTEAELADRLAGATLAGDVGRATRRRRRRMALGTAALTVVVAVVGLALPDRARAAWTPLLRPMTHMAPWYPPLIVAPGDTAVERGAEVDVTVRAALRERVTVHWRARGEVPGSRALVVGGGVAVGVIGPVEAETRYWVTSRHGAASDTFRIELRDPLLVTEVTLDAVYPSHTGLEADHYAGDVPPLRVPEGTVLRVRGRLTRAAEGMALIRERGPGGGAVVDGLGATRPGTGAGTEPGAGAGALRAELRGASFSLDWIVGVGEGGVWDWRVREPGSDGEAPGVPMEGAAPLELTVVPDAPPIVRIAVPGVDTLMPSSRRQPVVADASDDWGVAAGALVFRRAGNPDSAVAAFEIGAPAPRVLLRELLDASSLRLVPGDAVEYWVTVADNRPGAAGAAGSGLDASPEPGAGAASVAHPGVVRSRTYTLRLPGMAGLRDRARAESGEVVEAARRLAERTRSLESATRDLARRARRTERPGAPARPETEPLGFQDAARARDVLEGQEAVLEDVRAIRDRLTELERAVREAGLGGPELRRRLEEVRELYAQLESPELQASVEALRRALEALSPDAVREALERMAAQQEMLRRQVAESREMLRRAAAEQEMGALAREADELAARQEALGAAPGEVTAAGEAGDSAAHRVAARQEGLTDRTDRLATRLDSLRRELRTLREPDPAEAAARAGVETRSASAAMDTAADAVRGGHPEVTSRTGRAAAGALRSAAGRLDDARSAMAEARTGAAREAVRRATRETLELAARQEALRRELEAARSRGTLSDEAAQEARAEQAAVEQGLARIGRTLADAMLRSGRIDRQVGAALGRARQRMTDTGDALASEVRIPVERAAQAVESLNGLALSLLASEGRMAEGEGGDGTRQAMERLSELARQQGAVNEQTGALMPLGLGQDALARQLAELARRQAEIARGTGEAGETLGERQDVLGSLDALADEAEALARELNDGRLDPEVRARQERLFQRLLDAGRSLERDEPGQRRVAEQAGQAAAEAPAPLDAELLDTGLRYPVPTAAQLRGLPPAYRALVLEYFHLLNRESGEGGGG